MLYTVIFLTVPNMLPSPSNPENRWFSHCHGSARPWGTSEPRVRAAASQDSKQCHHGPAVPQPCALKHEIISLGQRPAEDWGGHQGRAGSCSSRSTSPFSENANVSLGGQMTQVHPRSWQNHSRVCQQMPQSRLADVILGCQEL